MRFCVLGSGSNGNSFYFENDNSAILIDAGLSFMQLKRRLGGVGREVGAITDVFITHEHIDHVRALPVLMRRLDCQIHATQATLDALDIAHEDCVRPLSMRSVAVAGPGGLAVEPFRKSHDAADPISVSVTDGRRRACVITDCGHPCLNVTDHVRQAHAVLLESNYDEKMLLEGRYPAYLKKRIHGDEGHLSNAQAARCVLAHASGAVQAFFLCHLSENNNTPDLALRTFCEAVAQRADLRGVPIHVASRTGALPLFTMR